MCALSYLVVPNKNPCRIFPHQYFLTKVKFAATGQTVGGAGGGSGAVPKRGRGRRHSIQVWTDLIANVTNVTNLITNVNHSQHMLFGQGYQKIKNKDNLLNQRGFSKY